MSKLKKNKESPTDYASETSWADYLKRCEMKKPKIVVTDYLGKGFHTLQEIMAIVHNVIKIKQKL